MIKEAIRMLISTLLINQLIHVFGKLTALREITDNGVSRMICISEDDGSTLTWRAKYDSINRPSTSNSKLNIIVISNQIRDKRNSIPVVSIQNVCFMIRVIHKIKSL